MTHNSAPAQHGVRTARATALALALGLALAACNSGGSDAPPTESPAAAAPAATTPVTTATATPTPTPTPTPVETPTPTETTADPPNLDALNLGQCPAAIFSAFTDAGLEAHEGTDDAELADTLATEFPADLLAGACLIQYPGYHGDTNAALLLMTSNDDADAALEAVFSTCSPDGRTSLGFQSQSGYCFDSQVAVVVRSDDGTVLLVLSRLAPDVPIAPFIGILIVK
jgi:hypothetical protein